MLHTAKSNKKNKYGSYISIDIFKYNTYVEIGGLNTPKKLKANWFYVSAFHRSIRRRDDKGH